MATSVSQQPASPHTGPASSEVPYDQLPYDQLIEQQLRKARRQLKIIDLASSLLVLAVGVLAFFLIVALVDHWLLPLSALGRWFCLVMLLGGVAAYLGAVVVPMLTRRINPLYAARSIEQSQPTLKNSLVNFLFLRGERRTVHRAIYEALRQRAATDLSLLEVESVVDYRPVIRLGIALAVIFGAAALYLMVSPKDPLQTVRRVAAPWANIARPTKVQIDDVQPGDRDIFHGQTQPVTARVSGVDEADPVRLVFSTADGQTLQRKVPMRLASDGLHWEVTLPVDAQDAVDPGGLQQDLQYHVAAGDAVSPTYRLRVRPAPTIIVKRIEYDFPDYTGRDDVVETGRGDIRALEGTRVTIHAESNQPIGQAYIEFDPHLAGGEASEAGGDVSGAGSPDGGAGAPDGGGTNSAAAHSKSAGAGRATLAMKSDGRSARRTFVLRLGSDRRTPDHDTYQVRFRTADGHESRYPVVHDIQVIPDLTPEVAILTPSTSPVEVAENGKQRIEVRAVDPDFGLREIRLRAVAGGTEVLDHVLFEDLAGRPGQTVVNFDFQPRQLGLVAGDRVSYWAMAEDNRTEPGSDISQPPGSQPNIQRTRNFQLIIVPPTAQPDAPRGDSPRSDQPPAQESSATEDPAAAENAGDAKPQQQGGAGQQGGSESGQSPEAAGSEGTGSEGEASDKARSDGGGDPQAGEGGKPDDTGPSSQTSEAGGTPSGDGGGEKPQPDQASGEGDGESSSQPRQGSGRGADSRAGRSGSTGESAREEPLHDGEVIEKVNELLERQKQKQQSQSGESSRTQDGPSSDTEGTEGTEGAEGAAGGAAQPGQDAPREAGDPENRDQASGSEQGKADDAAESPSQPATPEADGENSPPEPRSGGKPSAAGQDQGESADSPSGGAPSEGGQPQGDRKRPADKPAAKPESEPEDGARQGGLGDNGESGPGQESEDTAGSAAKQGENRDRPKSTDSGESTPPENGEAQSPSISKQQSDSQGGQSGDRSGGGKQGPGQSANQKGNDSAGSNSPADSGASAAPESGAGETAQRAGDAEQADRPTGKPGAQSGAGSQSRPRDDGSQSQPQAGDQAGGNAAGSDASDASSSESRQPEGQGTPNGPVRGGGKAGEGGTVPEGLSGEVPDGQEANLDYARKATEMALEHLQQQQGKADSQVLDELGWTQDDLRQFLSRWKRLQQGARSGEPEQRAELDEALRSLGLRPKQSQIRRAEGRDDAVRGLRESGSRSRPPSAYRDLFEAYQKSTSRRSDK